MSHIIVHSIPVTHPSLNGHFPGNPIVPGVVLLEEVLTALKEWLPDCHVKGFQTVKFLHPVKPNSNFTIGFNLITPESIKFMCRSDQLLLNTGTVILHSAQQLS